MKLSTLETSTTELPQPVRKAVKPEKATVSHRILLRLSKLFDLLKIVRESSSDILIQQQCKNAVDKNEYAEFDGLDKIKAKKRRADLERIERFKTGGM